MIAILVMLGTILVTVAAFFWAGLPLLAIALWARRMETGSMLPARTSVFSFSSVPAIMESRNVYEFIQTLKDPGKRAAYDTIMGVMRRLMLDVRKHRSTYPAAIDELKAFVLSQLRYYIEHSPARDSVETSKFRDLAENELETDVMQNIYMEDCKAARGEAARRIR